ncbi:hypothetical protein F4810DRAFT_690025 [Camillea tinctor]|nr:hypothetical protein F4810DRAFT_690025 [Camillea tinctor]
MVRKALGYSGPDLTGGDMDAFLLSQSRGYLNEIIGKYSLCVRLSMGYDLLRTLILIDDHPLVDEDTRLQIAETLLSKSALLLPIELLDDRGRSSRMSMLEYALRFKRKEWSNLLLCHGAEIELIKINQTTSVTKFPFLPTLPKSSSLRSRLYQDLDEEADKSSYPGYFLSGVICSSIGCPETYRAFTNSSQEETSVLENQDS